MPKNGAWLSPLQDQLSNQTRHFLVGRARFGWIAATDISIMVCVRKHENRYLMSSYFTTVTVSASMGMSRLKVCLNARPIRSPELVNEPILRKHGQKLSTKLDRRDRPLRRRPCHISSYIFYIEKWGAYSAV